MKRSGSGVASTAASPVTGSGPQTPESGRAAKKVRIDEPKVTVKDEEESEEDVEFEDAL